MSSSPSAHVKVPFILWHGLLLDAHHRFIPEECDLGFTRFLDLKKIYQPQEGHTRPLVEDDSTEITVFVRVLKDPTGVLWHNFVQQGCFPLIVRDTHRFLSYDAKKFTGFVVL